MDSFETLVTRCRNFLSQGFTEKATWRFLYRGRYVDKKTLYFAIKAAKLLVRWG